MDKKTLYLLREYISKYFYYVEYPNGLDKYFWKDADGNRQLMLVMSSEEIAACIDRVNTDINRFEGCQLTETQRRALDAILPLALRMKGELEEQLTYQIELEEEERRRQLSDYLDEIPASKPLHLQTDTPDASKVPIRVLLPLGMVKRLKAEGDIGATLEKYLLKAGFGETQGRVDAIQDEKSTDSPPKTNQFSEAWKKDIKNILNSSINAILGFANLALSPYKWPEETMKNYLISIQKAAHRIKAEIERM